MKRTLTPTQMIERTFSMLTKAYGVAYLDCVLDIFSDIYSLDDKNAFMTAMDIAPAAYARWFPDADLPRNSEFTLAVFANQLRKYCRMENERV
jgi:hypothetical protein